jgi:membrane protein DedA with SNARE-associated domain
MLVLSDLGLLSFSTSTLTHLLHTYGYPLVALFIAVESSGIPFPGETMLVTAAVYAGTGHLSIFWVIVAGASGAILGDNAGFLVGRRGGRPLVLKYGPYVRIKPEHLEGAERFFERHGDKTVFLGRFIAVLRAWAALLAGINGMAWPKFLLYNAAGGILWTTIFGLLGYTLGHNLPVLDRVLRILGVGGVVIAILIALAAYVAWRRNRTGQRAAHDSTDGDAADDADHDSHRNTG